jgi:hypothetical protein
VDPVPDAGAVADLGAFVYDGSFVDKHIQSPRFKVKGARKNAAGLCVRLQHSFFQVKKAGLSE